MLVRRMGAVASVEQRLRPGVEESKINAQLCLRMQTWSLVYSNLDGVKRDGVGRDGVLVPSVLAMLTLLIAREQNGVF